MPSSELKQLERELELAAAHFSMAERTSTLSEVDQAQSNSVSEARVLAAARSVLATDTTAPIDQLLEESVTRPMLAGPAGGQWRVFLAKVRRQLGGEDPHPDDWGPSAVAGRSRREATARTWLGLLIGLIILVIGAASMVIGGWLLSDGECAGPDCTNALQAVATTRPAPTTTDRQEPSTTLVVATDDGQPPRGGISAGEPSPAAVDEDETTAGPTTTTDDGSAEVTNAGPSSTTTVAGAAPGATTAPATTTPRSTAAPTNGAPTGSAGPQTAAPSTTTTTAAPTTTVIPEPDGPGPGVACPTGTAEQRLNVSAVADNDVLNIRLGPGTSFTIVAALAPDATGVRVYGAQRSGAWVMIVLPGTPSGPPPANSCGWVHAGYLAASPTPV